MNRFEPTKLQVFFHLTNYFQVNCKKIWINVEKGYAIMHFLHHSRNV